MISIIIPTFNNLQFTKNCLASIFDKTKGVDFEVVIVDNGSSDGTVEFLKKQAGKARIILNLQNLGFAKGCNQGATAAKGEILVFLNNDTVVNQGWLAALTEPLCDQKIGITGAKLLYPDKKIQHAGIVVSQDLIPRHIYRLMPENFSPANKKREFQAVTAACLAIKKQVFEEVGGFDEKYLNGLEDVDLCLKVGKRGLKILYCPESVVIHFESVSKDRFKAYFQNRNRYLKRWPDVKPDEDEYYRRDGFHTLFILNQHIKNRYLTGNYREKIKILFLRLLSPSKKEVKK